MRSARCKRGMCKRGISEGIRGAIQIRNTRCHEREGMGVERILCGSSEAAHIHRNQIQSDPISVQSVCNQCPIRDVSQSTPTISVPNQCTTSVQSVSNPRGLPIHTHHLSVQSVSNQCPISVQSVYNQCTISVQSVSNPRCTSPNPHPPLRLRRGSCREQCRSNRRVQ